MNPGCLNPKPVPLTFPIALFWLQTEFLNSCLFIKCNVFSNLKKIWLIIKCVLPFLGLSLRRTLQHSLYLKSWIFSQFPPPPLRNFSLLGRLYRGDLPFLGFTKQVLSLLDLCVSDPGEMGPRVLFPFAGSGLWLPVVRRRWVPGGVSIAGEDFLLGKAISFLSLFWLQQLIASRALPSPLSALIRGSCGNASSRLGLLSQASQGPRLQCSVLPCVLHAELGVLVETQQEAPCLTTFPVPHANEVFPVPTFFFFWWRFQLGFVKRGTESRCKF